MTLTVPRCLSYLPPTWRMNVLFLIGLLVPASALKTPAGEDYYHAAVVEYMPVLGSDPEDTLALNVNRYVEIISSAAEQADIVVFPEGGLNNGDLTIFTEIPYEKNKAIPIDETISTHTAIRNLSKAAKENNIYIAINIHESEDHGNETLRYNTNVVFDRNGSIIARYRKYNLYSENVLNTTNEPEHIYFDTDFGVRFGTFTCFDILFKEPPLALVQKYNVTDIVFTTWWFSELPFLTAVQEQASWSYATDTNLLASGTNAILRGSTGSGIYAGIKGPITYLLSQQPGSRLLTAKLYKKGKDGLSTGNITDVYPVPLGPGNLLLKKQYLEDFISELLKPDVDDGSLKKVYYSGNEGEHYFIQNFYVEEELCQSGYCCQFNVNMTLTYMPDDFPINKDDTFYLKDSFYHYRYRLAVFNGIRNFDNFATGGNQICAVISCLNDTFASCGLKAGNFVPLVIDTQTYGPLYLYSTVFDRVAIKTDSIAPDSYTFPQMFESSDVEERFGSIDNLADIIFQLNGSSSSLVFSSPKLISGAIYNRIYSRDGGTQGVTPSSAYCQLLSPWLLYIVSLLLMPKIFQATYDCICYKIWKINS